METKMEFQYSKEVLNSIGNNHYIKSLTESDINIKAVLEFLAEKYCSLLDLKNITNKILRERQIIIWTEIKGGHEKLKEMRQGEHNIRKQKKEAQHHDINTRKQDSQDMVLHEQSMIAHCNYEINELKKLSF